MYFVYAYDEDMYYELNEVCSDNFECNKLVDNIRTYDRFLTGLKDKLESGRIELKKFSRIIENRHHILYVLQKLPFDDLVTLANMYDFNLSCQFEDKRKARWHITLCLG